MDLSVPRFICNPSWAKVKAQTPGKGDYVIATKYNDGDPADHFCVGFYDGSFDHFGQTRHMIVDGSGQQFRRNGFRRVRKIGTARGNWIVANVALITRMKNEHSVWHWVRAPWSELTRLSPPHQTPETA